MSEEIKTTLRNLNLITKPISSHLLQAIIEISPEIVKILHKATTSFYAKSVQPRGLRSITLPVEFVHREHYEEINDNIARYLLKHIVLDTLSSQISNKKILMANHPRLTKMNIEKDKHARYYFDLSIASPIALKEWKFFSFKAPKRKRYKDLDKQVDLFIQREYAGAKKQGRHIVENYDWINFNAQLIDAEGQALAILPQTNLWMRINTKYIEKPFQKLFLGKKINESFITKTIPLNETLQDNITDNFQFRITIKDVIKGSFLSLDAFKIMFRLKNKTDIHSKLIEVFSYRNDISQRRAIVEEVFHLLFAKHRFEIPKHLTIRKQETLLRSLKQQPDYQVYKAQKDFGVKVAELSEKLLKEEILIDQISYNENIRATSKDIRHYLTLFNNDRLKEFVYFKPSFEPIEETDIPLAEGHLRMAVQREKTLNYIIQTLTK